MLSLPSGQASSSLRTLSLLFLLATSVVSTAHAQTVGPRGLDLLCPLEEHERKQAVEDAEFELELLENEYRSRKKVFEMMEKLWAARSIEREIYLDSKRLRDRTKASIARVTTLIAQRSSMAEQYALTCAQVRGEIVDQVQEKVDELQAEYRRLDCELLSRDLDIARIDYHFDKAMLEATRTLVEGNIKSKYELVIDEYDLSQSKARVESYKARTAICKKRLVE